MRLFVALQPDPGFLSALSALQNRCREAGVAARYLAPSNLHLTLAFIGEWPEEITSLLPEPEEPFSVTLDRVGFFPQADVLWAGTAPNPALDRLAARVRERLTRAGVPFDPKPFYPHITLGRKPAFPPGFRPDGIRVPAVSMPVREVCLYRSDHGPNGMIYTVIGRSGAVS